MGRKRTSAKGVEVRTYRSGARSIRIHFVYRGVICRETLKGIPPTAANLKYAANLKATIEHEISTGAFDYLARFPGSRKARSLSGASPFLTMRTFDADYRREVERLYQPATVRSYLQPLDCWVLPTFGATPIGEIDAPMIRRAVKELAMRGLKPKSVSNYKTALNRILDYAVDQGYIEANPALLVSVARATGRQEQRAETVDPFSIAEVDKIIATAARLEPIFARYLAFAFYTGLRTSELYALAWDDVDWNRNSVFITRAVVHGELKPMPKTAAGIRDVLLLPPALSALKQQRAATELLGGAVFINPVTDAPFRAYKETAGRWRRVLKKAKVRYRNQYQTRHTYASHLLSGGENPYFVARQLGHKNVEMVMRVYGRWIEQAARLDGHRWVADFGQARSERAKS